MALATVQDILMDGSGNALWPGTARLEMQYGDQMSGQGNGDTIVVELRPPLWILNADSRRLLPSEIRKWKAILNSLENGKQLFYGYDMLGHWPIAYPGGSWPTGLSFTGLSATLHLVGANNKSLTVYGLPAGYSLSVGDYVSFPYGSSPSYALHQVVEAVTADGSGHAGPFEVRPHIRPGASGGDAVTVAVKKPLCQMLLVPGSVKISDDYTGRGTISFQGRQYLPQSV